MTWYPDLGNDTLLARGNHVRAIGWLSSERTYSKGSVPPAFLARLRGFRDLATLSSCMLALPVCAGVHTCELCKSDLDARDFGVPAGDILYIAPGMVVHYIEHHDYMPPQEFIEAVMNSPLPDTPAYLAATAQFAEAHRNYWNQVFAAQNDYTA